MTIRDMFGTIVPRDCDHCNRNLGYAKNERSDGNYHSCGQQNCWITLHIQHGYPLEDDER